MGEPVAYTDFTGIYLSEKHGVDPTVGKMRMASSGFAWRESGTGRQVNIEASTIRNFQFLRVARGFELRVALKDGSTKRFNGFDREDFTTLSKFAKGSYDVPIDQKELSLKGWNWGRTEIQGDMLNFMVANRPSFEIPLAEISNSNLASKHEVLIELAQPDLKAAGQAKGKPSKEDSLTEIRFFIPGMAKLTSDGVGIKERKAAKSTPVKTENGETVELEEGEEPEDQEDSTGDNQVYDDEGEAMTAAGLFHDTITAKADLGLVVGEAICGFQELLVLTPRGRFEVDIFPLFLRLRGKSHDYKIMYQSIIKLFLLPKPDEYHQLFIIGLDPPIRQGQTRYPFIVFQVGVDEEVEVELNQSGEEIQKLAGKLKHKYDGLVGSVMGEILSAVSSRRVSEPAQKYSSHLGHKGIKCSLKANESYLFPLEKAFLFVPKPPTFIPHTDIGSATFSRVGGSASAAPTRTFEMKFNMKVGTDYVFGNINREEYGSLAKFMADKSIRVKNELAEETPAAGYREDSDAESGDEVKRPRVVYEEGAGNEDEDESEDEDFAPPAEEGSDVAEEFDEDAGSSASDSDDDSSASGSGGGDGDGGSNEEAGSDAEGSPKPTKSTESSPKAKKVKDKGKNKEPKEAKEPKEPKEPKQKKQAATKRKKDPNAPKRAKSAYLFFTEDARAAIKEELPDLTQPEILKECGIRWGKLSEDDKKPYDKKAALAKAQYEEAMAEYKASGGGADVASASSSPPAKKAKKASTSPARPSGSSPSSKKTSAKVLSAETIEDSDESE